MANESASFRLSPDGTQFGTKTQMESTSFRMEGGITWTNTQTLQSTNFRLQAAPNLSSSASSASSSVASSSSSLISSPAPASTDSGGRRGQGTTTTDLLDGQSLQIRQISSARISSSSSRRSSLITSSTPNSQPSSHSSQQSSRVSSVQPRLDNVDPLPAVVQSSAASRATDVALLGQLLRLDVSNRFDTIDPQAESVASVSSATAISSQIASSTSAPSSRAPDVAVLGSDVAVDRFDPTPVSEQKSGVSRSESLGPCQNLGCTLGSLWDWPSADDETSVATDAPLPWWAALLGAFQAGITGLIAVRIHRRVPYEAWHALWRRR